MNAGQQWKKISEAFFFPQQDNKSLQDLKVDDLLTSWTEFEHVCKEEWVKVFKCVKLSEI